MFRKGIIGVTLIVFGAIVLGMTWWTPAAFATGPGLPIHGTPAPDTTPTASPAGDALPMSFKMSPTKGREPALGYSVEMMKTGFQDSTSIDGVLSPWETGGPDDYGYTWDDSIPFNWQDAHTISGGTQLDLEGDDAYAGLDIGFEFPFYENTYSHLWVSTNGFVTFNESGAYLPSNRTIPYPGAPNNYIAPFWDDLGVNCCQNQGHVYYKRDGEAPNRYLVIEWLRVSRLWNQETLTFEVVLHENGDIVFQYMSMNGYLLGATVGIENDVGGDGALYLYQTSGIENRKAIRFRRPGPMARLKTWPLFYGKFTAAGDMAYFHVPIRNIGDVGADTYEVKVDATDWPVTLFRPDRLTPLKDTNGNGNADTGPLDQGRQFDLWVGVRTPASAKVGDHNEMQLTIRSTRNPRQKKTLSFRTAVPADFAQVYADRSNGAMAFDLVKPAGVISGNATGAGVNGGQMAMIELPNDNFFYAWVAGRAITDIYVSEIYYAIVDPTGKIVHPVSRLTDHAQAAMTTYDRTPALAVTNSGAIGVLFSRQLSDNQAGQNYNIFLSILDDQGDVQVAPVNITQNHDWGKWGDLNVPRFDSPKIVSTDVGNFLMSWEKFFFGNPTNTCDNYCGVNDIWYAVANVRGQLIHPLTQLTQDSPGWDNGYRSPAFARAGAQGLMAFSRIGDHPDIYFAVIDHQGNLVRNITPLTHDEGSSFDANADVARLADGKFIVAWTGQFPRNPGEQGWRGSYFNNETLNGDPVLIQNDPTINFDWGLGSAGAGVNRDFFSVRWEGTIDIPNEGDYAFYMGSDDGSRLFIDGQKVMDHWDACCVTWTKKVHLSSGQHRVIMEMHEHDGAAWARLTWRQSAGGGDFVIKFALLNANFEPEGDPKALPNPATYSGNDYPSVAAVGNRAVITWMDYDWSYRHNLYYALVDSAGNVLTPATMFRSAPSASSTIFTSFSGYGNTSYHWQPSLNKGLFLPITLR